MKQTSHFDIGLDFRMAAHTGIGTHLRGLVSGFEQNQTPSLSRLALFSPGLSQNFAFSSIFFNSPIYSLTEQFKYPEMVKLCGLWHAPHYNIPLCKGKTKLVVTIHDIIHWIYRDQLNPLQRFYAKSMLRQAVQKADHILTVSEHSKKDLVRYFNADPTRVTVVYNGVAQDFHPMPLVELELAAEKLRKKYDLPNSFFLYVGMLKTHKNVLRLLRTYLKLRSKNKIKSGLVIIGQGAQASPEAKLLADAKASLTHISKIDFGELPVFYNMAKALVHPSLYEGFGLTIVEALSCGTPVLTTRRASLSEVGGEAARYIDGENEEEMERALSEWDQDNNLKQRLNDACLFQASKFSWEKAARETAQVYEKVLNS